MEMTGDGLVAGHRSERAVPRRPPGRRVGLGRRRGARGHAAAVRRGAGARRADAARRCRAASRRRSTAAGSRCSSRSLQQRAGVALAGPRRLRERRGRRAGRRAGRRPRGRAGDRERARRRRGRADTVVVGELGLGGEVRQVPQIARRLAEAQRLGFARAIVPASTPDVPGIQLRSGRRSRAARGDLAIAALPPARRRVWYPRVNIPTWRGPLAQPRSEALYGALRLVAPGHAVARRHRPHPAGQDGRAHRRRRRARGAQHLLGRVPARRRVHAAAAVGAGQDGRRDHPRLRRHPRRAGQRAPRSRPRHPDHRDRHPAPHRRARRAPDRGAGDHGLRGDGRRVGALPRATSDARSRSRACSPAPIRRCRSSVATRRASTA